MPVSYQYPVPLGEKCGLVISLAACSGGGGDGAAALPGNTGTTTTPPPAVTAGSLNQAAYVSGTSTYRFGHRSILNMVIADAPANADYTRWAMLHDGAVYRLYLFKQNTNDTLYQFGFNARTAQYEYGHQSIAELKLTNIPDDADTSRFAMLHDGSTYRLYFRARSNTFTMYQFGYNSSTQNYEYG